jgi:hypothetical protein
VLDSFEKIRLIFVWAWKESAVVVILDFAWVHAMSLIPSGEVVADLLSGRVYKKRSTLS